MITTQQVNAGLNSSAVTKKAVLGKDDFFKLLLAQLKNQDPLKPMDGTDFAVQLAQFSSLEQLSNINTEIKNLADKQAFTNRAYAVGLLGRDVVAKKITSENKESTTETISGPVTGVRLEKNEVYVSLGGVEVSLSDVISIQ